MLLHDVSNISNTAPADRFVSISYISCWIPRLKTNLETLKSLEAKLVSNETFDVNFTDLNVFCTPQI